MTANDDRIDYRPQAIGLLIAASSDGIRVGPDALDSAGVRLVATATLESAATALAAHPAVDLILVDSRGADPTALAPVLDLLGDGHGGGAVIVALSTQQIDLVAARLLSGGVQLLCDPAPAELVAALAVPLVLAGKRVRGDDSEADRLRRLNDEVARIAETLARLTQGTSSPVRPIVGDRTLGYRTGPDGPGDVRAQEVRQMIRARRLRDQYFASGLLEDPAWDMLLDLFAADLERAQVSVSSLCIAAAVAPTTALRWIGRMTDEGLFERSPDPFDRRRAFMVLSAKAREAMRAYWAALKRLNASSV